MPVRYDIAAQVPQAQSGGFDPLNMMAQLQAMDYRQRQNALAEMQMGEYQRKLQAQQALRGLSPGGNFNIADPTLIGRAFGIDPDEGIKLAQLQRQLDLAKASTKAQRAAAQYHTGQLGLAEREFALKTPGITAEAATKRAGAVPAAATAVRELLRPVYMARTPEQAAERYADVYPQIKELDPNAARRLGYQYNPTAVSDFIVGPEEFKESRKPVLAEPGKLLIQPTGRPGEAPPAMEPVYTPPTNAMSPTAPTVNALAAPAPMIGDETLSPQEKIIQKNLRNRQLLQRVPPEDRPKVQSQLDLAEAVQAANQSFDRFGEAGGIPVAGQTAAENWKAKFRTTKAGQALGNLSDSQVAEEYNNLRTIAGIMRQRLAGAIGLTARQMDAAKEMEAFEKIVGGDPSAEGLASAKRRLNTINQLLGTGEAQRFESPRGKAGEAPKEMGGVVDFGSLK
jgi:hypothetical protein